MADDLENVALPWFSTTRDPHALQDAVPDGLLRPRACAQDLLEFLISQNLTLEADMLIRRYLSSSPTHRASFEEGRRLARSGQRPAWHSSPALGWSCEVLGLTATL
ncbi:hypothetical protein [Actinoplanes sp. NPDC023714]|uniref:hypothetical protein n=1 Tax=Actinoplanes sp. NPDC023714 TaxID=3154322 RepID=UPI00340AB602